MTRPLGYGALGAYSSSVCHYCGGKATTDDHIVPRAAFGVFQSRLPYWFRQHNITPSCQPCNNFKAHFRSDCECDQCVWVWITALRAPEIAQYIKKDFHPKVRRVIKVGQSRLQWKELV